MEVSLKLQKQTMDLVELMIKGNVNAEALAIVQILSNIQLTLIEIQKEIRNGN